MCSCLYVMGKRDEVWRSLTPSILFQTMSWNHGAEKAPLSCLLPGIVDGHVVTENSKQEGWDTHHVGKDGELHIQEHAHQLGSAPGMVCILIGGREPGPEVCSALCSFFIHSFFFPIRWTKHGLWRSASFLSHPRAHSGGPCNQLATVGDFVGIWGFLVAFFFLLLFILLNRCLGFTIWVFPNWSD